MEHARTGAVLCVRGVQGYRVSARERAEIIKRSPAARAGALAAAAACREASRALNTCERAPTVAETRAEKLEWANASAGETGAHTQLTGGLVAAAGSAAARRSSGPDALV